MLQLRKEYSAGGVVTKGGKVLLVRVKATGNPVRGIASGRGRNLAEGDFVWTFPKGHVDPGETTRRAALREVHEETGWTCQVRRSLALVRYSFTRKGKMISKSVRWYAMRPVRKNGRPDTSEIFGTAWLPYGKAKRRLTYPADFRLLSRVSKEK